MDFTELEFEGTLLESRPSCCLRDVRVLMRDMRKSLMNHWKVEPIALAVGGRPTSCLRVTWQTEPGWFARLFRGIKSVQTSATFAGTGEVWHMLPGWRRAPRAFESQLREAESQLLLADLVMRVPPQKQASPDRDSTPPITPIAEPEMSTAPDSHVSRHERPDRAQSVSSVQAHSRAEPAAHRRFRRPKLH
jgi:hypothetical protein